MLNGPSSIFVKRRSGPGGFHDEVFHDDDHVARVITKIMEDSSVSHGKLDLAGGLQDAQLDDGARMHIVHADIGRNGQASLDIFESRVVIPMAKTKPGEIIVGAVWEGISGEPAGNGGSRARISCCGGGPCARRSPLCQH